MEDLKLYQELVDTKAEQDSSDILPNAGDAHAAIVMSKMFEKTLKSVKMVVGSFDGKVSNQANYLEKLEICINKKIPFQIIHLEPINTASKAYKLLKTKKKEGYDITIKTASPALRKTLTKDNGEIVHFAVFDDNKFRFEKDSKNYIALFSFNDKVHAQSLLKVFDSELLSKEIN